MSGRLAALLGFIAFLAAADAPREWMTATWSSLVSAAEESSTASAEEEPEVEPGGKEEGWLIDPNG